MRTGSETTCLIVIRGNSGSGKSSLAAALRIANDRPTAILGQDVLRRQILHVAERQGNAAIGYLDLSARYALDLGMDVVIEGILYADIYGDMLAQLAADHRGPSLFYRYEMGFEETLRRHNTKLCSHEFGEPEMRSWWRGRDPLPHVAETALGEDVELGEAVARVLADTRSRPTPELPQAPPSH
ncbi:kinase [Glutamicibacter sp. PS]|uniref:kinase n=1 Tax=Glutamicibacter sp. PS TaxID=3075634 RepID=UPI0028492675|nr:kinase [Glutamicibacter sp. PS]MDR4534468.1 kinase [Glutamicibacter sp. PS]